ARRTDRAGGPVHGAVGSAGTAPRESAGRRPPRVRRRGARGRRDRGRRPGRTERAGGVRPGGAAVNVLGKKKIVLLGMMTRMPVAGAVWGTMHYLVGFQRLGYDVYYVEAHAKTPYMLMEDENDDSSAKAAAFLDRLMRRFDLGDHWAFHALHDDGRYYGMTEMQLKQLYSSAALIINHHGATVPLPEHYATGRLIYLETDPVELQTGL